MDTPVEKVPTLAEFCERILAPLVEHEFEMLVKVWVLPDLCGPWGRMMPC